MSSSREKRNDALQARTEGTSGFGISRAAYSAWVNRLGQTDLDQPRLDWVPEAYAASPQTDSYRRIPLWLAQKRHRQLNHKTVLRRMRQMGLHLIARQVIEEYIHFYNCERIHLKTQLTPYERRCQLRLTSHALSCCVCVGGCSALAASFGSF